MGREEAAIVLSVNGRRHEVAVAHDASLLTVLRDRLQLNGPKYGCGLGECGACTVLIDGVAARSCVIPVAGVPGRDITTLEGLAARARCGPGGLHPVQQAFIEAQAAQCGYCLNGMIMTVVALLERERRPSAARIRDVLAGNLCRCGAHLEILRAVEIAMDLCAAGFATNATGSGSQ